MSEPREIMAAAIDNEHRRAGGPDSWLPEVDVALAALTAAGFAVRRRVEREVLREWIAFRLFELAQDRYAMPPGSVWCYDPRAWGSWSDVVLAVLDGPTGEGNGL